MDLGGPRSGFDLKWLVEDFQVALTQELDFTLEAKHAERARHMFAHRHDVKVPEVLWETTCKRVVTMEYVAGARVNDTAAIAAMGLSETKVASALAVRAGCPTPALLAPSFAYRGNPREAIFHLEE